MRTGQIPKEDWKKVDAVLRREIKSTLYLPENAANGFLYGSRASGCCALPLASEDADLYLLDTACKLLTSKDAALASLHHGQPETSAASHFGGAGSIPVREYGGRLPKNRNANIWTSARVASRRLGVLWNFDDEFPTLSSGDVSITAASRHKVLKSVREKFRKLRAAELLERRNQGKVMECVAAAKASSHFLFTGEYTKFADWWFIHRARLNLVPLNGAKPWASGADTEGRKGCNQAETLPHVLQCCLHHSRTSQNRHNAVLQRVLKAAGSRARVLSVNSQIPGTALRPDAVIAKGNTLSIVNVSIPFENQLAAFATARQKKLEKYEPLRSLFSSRFSTVQVVPIIVGSLGWWDPSNDNFLKPICSKSYLKTFRKLCASDTIRWSRSLYIEHLTGNRQYNPEDEVHIQPIHLPDAWQ
ncbi:uncharacterized protein LOC129230407 [Uloborus diversus]|uniref:uncharacterized protein LOC129230407 n=1 Tax=Uloborus diversus TaxID=327109 RepID=UPI002409400C|nr:uncharacterized protein LOC129230407 [Uloborus diversus]